MKSAIVTGATGAIGSALIKELVKRGIEVLVFTRKDSKRNENILQDTLVKIRYCSLSDLKIMEPDINIKYDAFFHLAWMGTTGEDRNNKDLQEKNVEYALDAMNCAKRFGCKKFIGIGSQAEYGRVKETLKESTPTNPDNEYGKAKLKACNELGIKAKDIDIIFNWVRVLSVYGINDTKNSLISQAIEKLTNNMDLDVTACEQIWDYLYSEDAAKALYCIAEKSLDNNIFVLGSGNGAPLKDYIETIKGITKSKSNINYGAIPYSDKQIMYLCADISKLELIGWHPLTKFEDGISKIVENKNS